jgi:hypothetical protein
MTFTQKYILQFLLKVLSIFTFSLLAGILVAFYHVNKYLAIGLCLIPIFELLYIIEKKLGQNDDKQ